MATNSRMVIEPPTLDMLPISIPPPRPGPRPATNSGLPHTQLDQWPSPALVERLTQASVRLPQVTMRQTRMMTPDTWALSISDGFALGPAEAFIDGNEFCYLHGAPSGSVHLTLPQPLRQQVIELGWAEDHPLVTSGFLTQPLIMVYAPRDSSELAVVLGLLEASYNFARGSW